MAAVIEGNDLGVEGSHLFDLVLVLLSGVELRWVEAPEHAETIWRGTSERSASRFDPRAIVMSPSVPATSLRVGTDCQRAAASPIMRSSMNGERRSTREGRVPKVLHSW